MNPRDVVKYIEGEPKIGVVPTEPGLTNVNGERVVGMNTENTEINEGTINFDIVFYVRMKDGLSQIIVNVEAQKRYADRISYIKQSYLLCMPSCFITKGKRFC